MDAQQQHAPVAGVDHLVNGFAQHGAGPTPPRSQKLHCSDTEISSQGRIDDEGRSGSRHASQFNGRGEIVTSPDRSSFSPEFGMAPPSARGFRLADLFHSSRAQGTIAWKHASTIDCSVLAKSSVSHGLFCPKDPPSVAKATALLIRILLD